MTMFDRTVYGNNTLHHDETIGIVPNPKGVSHVHAKFIHYNNNVNTMCSLSLNNRRSHLMGEAHDNRCK